MDRTLVLKANSMNASRDDLFTARGQNGRFQLELRGGYGETEVVWAARRGGGVYEILNTPVYAYNVSAGTLVRGDMMPNGRLHLVEVAEPSPGVTVRIMTLRGSRASEVYHSHILLTGTQEGLRFGPVTMLDPRIAAMHLSDRKGSLKRIIQYFEALERDGTVLRWELADPDSTPPEDHEDANSRTGVELVHPPT